MSCLHRLGWLRLIICTCFVMLTFSGFTAAQETPTPTPDLISTAPRGTVNGKVTNGTAASPAPTNITVTLFINNDNLTVWHMDTQTTADGSFQFNDVPVVKGYDYVTAALYRDRIFNSAFLVGNEDNTNLTLPINIYELTEDPTVLSISSSEAQISAQGGTLEVRQVIHFHNNSDRLYTTSKDLGDGRFGSVLISLPPGAQVVSLDNQTRYIVSPTNFTVLDTTPVLPGDEHVVIIAYIIPYDGTAALIEQPMNYPFEGSAKLLVAQTNLNINSQQLPSTGNQMIADTQYKRYEGALKLKAGEVIRYEISGASSTNLSAGTVTKVAVNGGNNAILFILTALIGLGILATALAIVFRQRQNRPVRSDQLIDALTQQITLLDQKHSAGELPHDLWHQQRRPLQARLEELQGE
ncbi:MAG: hypothetical protein GC179_29260 [Anaerolineaceae bacterium]|nr:hypothetical protein [Anaerolineaceae bacterium]